MFAECVPLLSAAYATGKNTFLYKTQIKKEAIRMN
jgi:hypothetical protein